MKIQRSLLIALLTLFAGSAFAQGTTTNTAAGGGSGMSISGSKSGIATKARMPRKVRRTRRR